MTTTSTLLPHTLPSCANARVALFAMRRMGAHGIGDARASHALFTAFGRGFQRPLLLLRILMAELASTATGTIAIAHCCCPRMTPAEAALMRVLASIDTPPETARLLMADLLGVRRVEATLMAAAAVSAAFADAGRPIR